MEEMMLTIRREASEIDKHVPYQIVINNILMGEIENDSIKNFDLKVGSYKMQLRGSRFVSNIVEFTITVGTLIEFTCKPKWKETTGSLVFYKLVKKKEGISLKLKQDIYL